MGENICRELEELRTEVAIIPGGPTSVPQPLDVCGNEPFKDTVRHLYTDWMAQGGHALMPTGKMQRPPLELICSRSWMHGARCQLM